MVCASMKLRHEQPTLRVGGSQVCECIDPVAAGKVPRNEAGKIVWGENEVWKKPIAWTYCS